MNKGKLSRSLVLSTGTLATAVTGTNVGDNTVAIVGTSTDSVIKILVANGQATVVDSFVAADNEPILPNSRMHQNNVDLIVLMLTPRERKLLTAASWDFVVNVSVNVIHFVGGAVFRTSVHCKMTALTCQQVSEHQLPSGCH